MSGKNELRGLVGPSEAILYEGKPSFLCFIFESIFNPMLLFSLIWGFIDIVVLGGLFNFSSDSGDVGLMAFLLIFMCIHMMPVWMYLGGVLSSFGKYRHVYYIVTDKAIYVSEGLFKKFTSVKPFYEPSHVDIRRNLWDHVFGVGDLIVSSSHMIGQSGPANTFNQMATVPEITISSISEYQRVFQIIREQQEKAIQESKQS